MAMFDAGDLKIQVDCWRPGDRPCEFTVWEPSLMGAPSRPAATYDHSSVTTFDGRWYGRIGSRRLPADVEALPGFGRPGHEKRREAVRRWFQDQCDTAARAVYDTFFAEPSSPYGPDALSCGGVGEDPGIVGIVRGPFPNGV